MSSIMKAILVAAQLCPLLLAADCNVRNPATCAGQDETSLLQVKKTLQLVNKYREDEAAPPPGTETEGAETGQYELGALHTKKCTTGFVVTDLAFCEAAAVILEFPFAFTENNPGYPHGCSETGGSTFFNTALPGKADEHTAPICEVTAPVYVQKASAAACAAVCPSGTCESPSDEAKPECAKCTACHVTFMQAFAAADPGAVTFGSRGSHVERAVDHWKYARSNTSIAKYAWSTAKVLYTKAIWASAKATCEAEGRTVEHVRAERLAENALVAAEDEADAWLEAVVAQNGAELTAAVAEADSDAKHDADLHAQAMAADASAATADAEANAKQTETVQQSYVNDAAAEESAVSAHHLKEEAAIAAAARRAAAAVAAAKGKAWHEARHHSWKAWKHAVHDEWHSAHQSWHTQHALEAAAGAAVEGELADFQAFEENATAPAVSSSSSSVTATSSTETGALTLAQVKQPTETSTVTTKTVETVTSEYVETDVLGNTSTNLDNVTHNASKAVQSAQELVAEAASDEKKAKSAAYVAKYAADHAARAKKVAQLKSDAAWRRAQHLSHHSDKLAREAMEAVYHVNVSHWRMESALADNETASDVKYAAEHFTYDKAHDVRNALSVESATLQAWKEAQAASKRQAIIDEASSDEIDAQTDAEHAAKMRIINDMTHSEMDEAEESAHDAHYNLTKASEAEHDANHAYMEAEHEAAHDANQAEDYDAKAAAADLDFGVNVTEINSTMGDPFGVTSSTVVTSSSSSSSSSSSAA